MASEITHVVYGKKIFDRLDGLSWPEFLAGTLFPDIRYPAKLDRDSTHVYNTSEKDIPKDDSFKAGAYVHCLIDEKRIEFVDSKKLGAIFSNRFYGASFKLVEDLVCYDRINNWSEITSLLKNFDFKGKNYSVNSSVMKNWYDRLVDYFSKGPTEKVWTTFILAMGFEKEVVKEVIRQTRKIQNNKKAMTIIKETYNVI